ncbi:exopolyphosphatase PRUNE1 [Venturia canescens]|uniref:exopolyphosphatase PRUNE1 n=1 Tax=Venturia canescens TaxID=32260 RepID=UPI001C9D4BF7|nr:exopolyphosphatase PRUNE1 [Venturia canescens]
MNNFLIASKSALNDLNKYERVRVVSGNSTCDLDSAVCALVLGYYQYESLAEDDKKKIAVIPIMNISEREYRIKTEVVWFLRANGIHSDAITFRNQLDLAGLANEKKLELTLVDHHALGVEDERLANSVVEIIDHRPRDPTCSWPPSLKLTLEPVGSCATLVAHEILTKNPTLMDARIRALLRGPILVDTHNLSAQAARARPLDREIIRRLEEPVETVPPREQIYEEILAAKTDVSNLTAEDLLLKDLKVVDEVALPGFPILVEEFVKLPNALEDVLAFGSRGSFTLVILLGMDLRGEEKIRRDVGIFIPSRTSVEQHHEILSRLMGSDLGLENRVEKKYESSDGNSHAFITFRQTNVRLTRKQIIPIIRSAMTELRARRVETLPPAN